MLSLTESPSRRHDGRVSKRRSQLSNQLHHWSGLECNQHCHGIFLVLSGTSNPFISWHETDIPQPKKGVKIAGRSKRQALSDLDWTGVVLLTATIILILVPVSLGGSLRPWKSAAVIVPFILGGLSFIALVIWESKISKNPFMARELFAGKWRTFTMFLVVDFVAGMGLYAAAAFWAQFVRGVWLGDPIKVGITGIPGGVGGALGGFVAGMVIGKSKIFSTNKCLIYGCVLKTLGDGIISRIGPGRFALGYAAGFVSMMGTGVTSVSLIVCVQLNSEDADIGMATLLLGSVRAIGGSCAVSIYASILSNYIQNHVGTDVGLATIPLGLPLTSLEPLILAMINEYDESVALAVAPGITPEIYAAGREALTWTYTGAFHNLYMTAAIFAGASVVAALLTKDVSHNMTDNVAVRLENEKVREEKIEL